MTYSNTALNFIADWEKFRAKAYLDSKRVPTIGYGSTRINGVPVKLGDTISEPNARLALHTHCEIVTKAVQRLVRVPVRQNQLDAMVSFAYNVGQGGFSTSTLLKTLNAQQPVIEDMWTRWNKITDPQTGQLIVLDGLTRRRKAEYALFVS